MNTTLSIAFFAGLISFLSPCVLPLIPGYISYISGTSLEKLIEKKILEESGLKGKIKRPNADYVKHVTGFSIGGVSPLTISDNIPILIDENLNRFKLLWASAGHTHWVFPIEFQDLVRLTKGKIVNNISKD